MKITSKTRLQGTTPEDNLYPALETGNLAILAGGVSGGHYQVDVLSGGGAGEQYADNAVVNAAYKGNLILGTDGTNYQIIGVDSSGHLQLGAGTAAIGKLAANNAVDIGDVDVPGSTLAHDAVDSGNPHKIGMKAVAFDGTAPPNAAVAEDDRANAIGDLYGRLYVETTHPNYWNVSADYAAAQTDTSVKAAPGVGLSLYITDIVISNGATAGNITLLDGSAGAVKFEIYPAINGGCSTNLRTPIKLTANTALCITSTTVTTHSVNITGFIAP